MVVSLIFMGPFEVMARVMGKRHSSTTDMLHYIVLDAGLSGLATIVCIQLHWKLSINWQSRANFIGQLCWALGPEFTTVVMMGHRLLAAYWPVLELWPRRSLVEELLVVGLGYVLYGVHLGIMLNLERLIITPLNRLKMRVLWALCLLQLRWRVRQLRRAAAAVIRYTGAPHDVVQLVLGYTEQDQDMRQSGKLAACLDVCARQVISKNPETANSMAKCLIKALVELPRGWARRVQYAFLWGLPSWLQSPLTSYLLNALLHEETTRRLDARTDSTRRRLEKHVQ